MGHGNDQEETENCQRWLQTGQIAQTDYGGRVGNDDTRVLHRDQGQEEADTGANADPQAVGDRVDDPLPHLEHAQDQEGDPGEEHGAQRHLPGITHAHHNTEGEEGVQTHARSLSNRVVGIQTHNETAESRCQTGRHKDGTLIHTGLRQYARVDENDVGHGQEGGQPCQQFSANTGIVFREFKQFL